MQPAHADAVGRLHAEHMPDSLLSSLGPDLLAPLYRSLLESGYGLGFVLIRRGRAVGFSFGRPSHTLSILGAILRGRRHMAVALARLALRGPWVLPKALLRLREKGHVVCEPGVGELVSIVVATEARGVASQRLAEALFDELRRAGCHTVRWETLASNVQAQRFYAKIGGRVTRETEVAGKRNFWFERELGDAATGRPTS